MEHDEPLTNNEIDNALENYDKQSQYNLIEEYRALIYFEDDPARTKVLNELLEQVIKEHKQ